LYSTDAFDKGKEDKSKKKVVGKAAAKEMANESTQVYVRAKRKYMKEKKQTKAAADKKKKNETE